MAKKIVNDKRCKNCNKIKALTQFHKDVDVCKSCLSVLITESRSGVPSLTRIDKVMKLIDRPFVEDICIRVLNEEGTKASNFMGFYLKQLNLRPEYKDAHYCDSILFNMKNEHTRQAQIIMEEEAREREEVTDEMRFFWTRGVSDLPNKEILILQKMYDEYTNNGDSSILTSKKIVDDMKTLCTLELQKSKIQYNLDEVKTCQTLQKMIDDLSESLGITAIQKSVKFDSNRLVLGLIGRYKEDVKKEPIPRWCEDLKHYNPMKDLIKVHYLGGMANAMGVSNPEIEMAKSRLKEFEVTLKEENEEDDENENNKQET